MKSAGSLSRARAQEGRAWHNWLNPRTYTRARSLDKQRNIFKSAWFDSLFTGMAVTFLSADPLIGILSFLTVFTLSSVESLARPFHGIRGLVSSSGKRGEFVFEGTRFRVPLDLEKSRDFRDKWELADTLLTDKTNQYADGRNSLDDPAALGEKLDLEEVLVLSIKIMSAQFQHHAETGRFGQVAIDRYGDAKIVNPQEEAVFSDSFEIIQDLFAGKDSEIRKQSRAFRKLQKRLFEKPSRFSPGQVIAAFFRLLDECKTTSKPASGGGKFRYCIVMPLADLVPEPEPAPELESPQPEPEPPSPKKEVGTVIVPAELRIFRDGKWIDVPGREKVQQEKVEANGVDREVTHPAEKTFLFNPDNVADFDTIVSLAPPEIPKDPDPDFLRDMVAQSGQRLRFTRNISLGELGDMSAQRGMKRRNGGAKCFRYGLGHGYGKEGEVITIVMKPGFWDEEKERDDNQFVNMFLSQREFEAGEAGLEAPVLDNEEYLKRAALEKNADADTYLLNLARRVDYNQNLQVEDSFDRDSGIKGMTVVLECRPKCMEYYPQLDIYGDRDLSMIDRILVPEHLWDQALAAMGENNPLAKLLYRVDGTGKTREGFIEGSEQMARRSRIHSGRYQPNMGPKAFHIFEQAFFRISLNREYSSWAKDLMWDHGYTQTTDQYWVYAHPLAYSPLRRGSRDWKIFINPRWEEGDENEFANVLEQTLQVLRDHNELGIEFKIPYDLSQKWRGRSIGSEPNTPKIVVYVNEETLPIIIAALDERFATYCPGAGFGDVPGPSFAKRYGRTRVISYKKEYERHRADIANKAGGDSENKQRALFEAGFRGENYYIESGDYDPIEGRRVY